MPIRENGKLSVYRERKSLFKAWRQMEKVMAIAAGGSHCIGAATAHLAGERGDAVVVNYLHKFVALDFRWRC